MTKTGDLSLNLREVNVIFQVSSHYGSKQQESQRFGRGLRTLKPGQPSTQVETYFYSLISKGTRQENDAKHWQEFLEEQGYSVHHMHADHPITTPSCSLAEVRAMFQAHLHPPPKIKKKPCKKKSLRYKLRYKLLR